ncbi:MAG: hypothetical protein UY44_C0008G0032 [Candidatus Kaiserbacteria bacterium GW2011_GWA2_49_19]|uniref:N-acetyltransferase domain-containing protein n=2 Tax=Candidatus Kaiseribacteriota TaxID=1752734 RepID=A0A0G1Y1A6_9BACT|nr:MAG: hypothetical protein UY44_C0008G0032 [Candidatus Kaiserbacteria bacterium GW2011_GWA2_49_19]OGG60942.1 MAG: hypothetical protein A3C86_04110 [Candidatus Kaiserbacteria bacterium RIFCSPHIGHO2_02_FULL_49_16]
MNELLTIRKEFGEIERLGSTINIRKFGSESIAGSISLVPLSEPIRLYLVYDLKVEREEQGKGFASQLMAEVEKISRESSMPVVLHDATDKEKKGGKTQNPLSIGMYKKRKGWVEVMDPSQTYPVYVYGTRDKVFEQIVDRIKQGLIFYGN